MNSFAKQHAKDRVAERYGNVNLGKLLKTIQNGEAKFVCFGHQDRLIYDVPCGDQTIRALVNAEKTIIISVLPNEFRSETYRRNAKQVKRAFFRRAEDDEEPVAPY